jgi:hypothetical protein
VRAKGVEEYVEITQSALKKAKKNAEGLAKKAKKAEELKQREEQEKGAEAERLQKKLEESKKIVLEEDQSLPKAAKVCLLLYLSWESMSSCLDRPRSATYYRSAQNACMFLDGSIDYATRRELFLSIYVMVLDTSRLF